MSNDTFFNKLDESTAKKLPFSSAKADTDT